MATIDDFGTPGAPLGSPSLADWAAAVARELGLIDARVTVIEGTPTPTVWGRWSGTQAEYDALPTKDPNTLYVVTAP